MPERLDAHTVLVAFMADPARHSMSPTMHNEAFARLGLNYAYLAFEVTSQRLAAAIEAIRALGLRGAQISMPHKQAVIQYLDALDPAVELCGAVNTVVNDDGVLTGHTTDGIGFMKALDEEGIDIRGGKMTLTGAGGAATAIAAQAALDGLAELAIFQREGASLVKARRSADLINERTTCTATVHLLEDRTDLRREIADSAIYCDATPLGMGALEGVTMVSDPAWFRRDMVVFDAVYAPRTTRLMQVARAAGVRHVLNGLGMLLWQGAESFRLWTHEDMPVDYIRGLLFAER
jgi:shikimate dehydrogenase